jgi:hypothetical protein
MPNEWTVDPLDVALVEELWARLAINSLGVPA